MTNLINLINYSLRLVNILPDLIKKCYILNNEIYLLISKKDLLFIIFFLKNSINNQYKSLVDLTAVDFLQKKQKIEIYYFLLSIEFNFRIALQINLSEAESIETVSYFFKSANWLEREVWDLFGVIFLKHPDLRRILTDYGFNGHPLRKDFPLIGYTELRYDEEKKSIIYESIEMAQEMRLFNFLSPWEQKKYIKNL